MSAENWYKSLASIFKNLMTCNEDKKTSNVRLQNVSCFCSHLKPALMSLALIDNQLVTSPCHCDLTLMVFPSSASRSDLVDDITRLDLVTSFPRHGSALYLSWIMAVVVCRAVAGSWGVTRDENKASYTELSWLWLAWHRCLSSRREAGTQIAANTIRWMVNH